MSLLNTLRDSSRFPVFYGTTPPRLDTPPDKYERTLTRLTERVRDLALDGVVVYDVQDESERTSEPRPFPFLPTFPSHVFSARVQEATGLPTVTYKFVGGYTEQEWSEWLDTIAIPSALRYLSLVGRATSLGIGSGLSLAQAVQLTGGHPAGFTVGGVVIPERHRPTAETPRSESIRLLQKSDWGCDYFISQAIYSPEATISLLQDYHADCVSRGTLPRRIILTFTPCGRPKTLEFMKWLGIAIPAEVEGVLTTAPDPLAASVDLCLKNLRAIMETGIGDVVPLGLNIESVSNSKEEIAAAITLCSELPAAAKRG